MHTKDIEQIQQGESYTYIVSVICVTVLDGNTPKIFPVIQKLATHWVTIRYVPIESNKLI